MFADWAKFAGFSAILAIAMAVGILALQEPPKPAQEYQRPQPSETHPNSATNWTPWLAIFKPLTSGGLQEITEYCNSYSDSEKKQWPQSHYCEVKVTDVWLAIFTGLLFLVTGGLGVATIKLWNATVENERPWVGPLTTNLDQIIAGHRSRGTIVIKNTGRSPALKMRITHRGIILNRGEIPALLDVWEVPKALFPGVQDEYHPPIEGGPISHDDAAALLAGTKVLWIIARIEYFDRDGNFHHTNIRTRWGGMDRPVMVPEGENDAN